MDPMELDGDLLEALEERGHDWEAIRKMSPYEAVKEYAGWHLGDPSWGSTFWELIESAKAAEIKKEDSQ